MKTNPYLILFISCAILFTEVIPVKAEFILCSPVFADSGNIPIVYTAATGGKEISPPLFWSGAPENTKSFALICEDISIPLIGPIVHWIIYDISPDTRELREAIPITGVLPDGSRQGKNFYRKPGYMGPNPPWGTHRYVFKLYALDCKLQFDKSPDKKALFKAMNGHILNTTQLNGVYSRWM